MLIINMHHIVLKEVRQKTKELGQEYTAKQYAAQAAILAGIAGGISYLYFFSLLVALVYAAIAILFIPYFSIFEM